MGCSPAIVLVALATGCALNSVTYVSEISADGVTDVLADSERGNLAYAGEDGSDTFRLAVTSWAIGVGPGDAEKQRRLNQWEAEPDGGVLGLRARSRSDTGVIDFVVQGPDLMNVDASLREGDVFLKDLEGVQQVVANGVVGRNLRGSADLYAASRGIDVEITPTGDDPYVFLEAVGDVVLRMPPGTAMQLLVFADPQWGVSVTDLGFDALHVRPDYVAAESGEGTTQVEVHVTGGRFVLAASTP